MRNEVGNIGVYVLCVILQPISILVLCIDILQI